MDSVLHSASQIRLRRLAAISLCAATTAIGALITIPLPIPITLQVFGVYLSGFLLGPLFGALSQAIYIIVGFAGLPVFAGGTGGLSIIASPTLGYLIAFPIASAIVGYIAHKKSNSYFSITIAIACGLIVIYTFGVAYFYFWSAHIAGKPISVIGAVSIGALPFLAIDIAKGYIAALVFKAIPRNLLVFTRK